jgi:poly-gamma-glutamate synthesis protein (capsule biosynthesis protein)
MSQSNFKKTTIFFSLKTSLITILYLFTLNSFSQDGIEKDSLSIIFMGDIMGHDPQIKSAYNKTTKSYNYDSVFSKVAPIIKSADFAIANLEVTLAGAPYKGYPRFSSPDKLAEACKNNGIDILVTANNHSCDRGKKGLLRTLKILDTLDIKHTGTFKDIFDKNRNNLLIFTKNNIKVGLLNYTYGTNGLPIPEDTFVNQIDTLLILSDISKSRKKSLDKLIVMLHWGNEYQSKPSKKQKKIANFLFRNGVDIIIGAHPHVLQPMEFRPSKLKNGEKLIAFSLGNFVSNQRPRRRDGGAMLKFTITKENGFSTISSYGYYLTWIHKPKKNGKTIFEILPCNTYESNGFLNMNEDAKTKMKLFLSDTRTLYKKENVLVKEIKNAKNK